MGCRVGLAEEMTDVLICIDMMQLIFDITAEELEQEKVRNGAEFGKNPEMRDRGCSTARKKLSILFAFGKRIWVDKVL